MPNFLLYAANLHVGGAVQVTASVIDEISRMDGGAAAGISLLVSSQVDRNLRAIQVPLERFRDYRVEDHAGIRALARDLRPALAGVDAMLVMFGPLYQMRVPVPCVVGFAQPWIIYPDNEIHRRQPLLDRWRTRAKFGLQSLFFRKADVLAVELEHVQCGVVRAGIAAQDRVRVVRNCLSALYTQPERWTGAPQIGAGTGFRLGFVGRNYPHKNIGIFPEVRRILRRDHGVDATLYVTFTDSEWMACAPEFRAAAVNVGPLDVAQCPAFYQQLDGVLFPSLLECFSATPLEAMAMKRPLFASDRPFNRDVCGNAAFYFDPLDPASAANTIATYLRARDANEEKVDMAYRHVMSLPGPDVRARQYLECLRFVAAMRTVRD